MDALNMNKGETLNLSKEAKSGLALAFVGAGWDPVKDGPTMDLDLVAILLGKDGKVYAGSSQSVAYFNDKVAGDGSVMLHGDNLTGEGEGDDETISIDFSKIPEAVDRIVLIATIYGAKAKGQALNQLQNAHVRIVTEAGKHGDLQEGQVISRFEIQGSGMTGATIQFGELVRNGTEWEFKADGSQSDKELGDFLAQF